MLICCVFPAVIDRSPRLPLAWLCRSKFLLPLAPVIRGEGVGGEGQNSLTGPPTFLPGVPRENGANALLGDQVAKSYPARRTCPGRTHFFE